MDDRLKALQTRIGTLSDGQLALLGTIIDSFKQPIDAWRLETSDVVCQEFLTAFGDVLKLQHGLFDDYLDKHRFEAAIERVYNTIGRSAVRAHRGNPGHDITVDGVPWSLKTQGDSNIKRDALHISKFMELGKGDWTNEAALAGLRNQFIQHMLAYERIFQLRYFKLNSSELIPASHFYELVEIPKSLLQESVRGEIAMNHKSKQTPKPGYCTVFDADGAVKYRLYFDGGTERKLQIRDLQKKLCTVHASWEF